MADRDEIMPEIPSPIFMQTGNIPMFGNVNNQQNSIIDPFMGSEPMYGHIEVPTPPIEDEPIFQFPDKPVEEPITNGQQEAPATKYMIFDLFWFLNPKYSQGKQPVKGEVHFVIVSFNVSFGNLRISFFNLNGNSIQGNIVYLENLKRLIVGTIYPSSTFNIINSPRLSMICLEQLFKEIPGADWQKNRPVCQIEKNEELIRLSIKDNSGSYFYDFAGWQKDAFLHACKFAVTSGFELTGRLQVNKSISI